MQITLIFKSAQKFYVLKLYHQILTILPAAVELSNKNCLNLLSILCLTPLVYPASEASEKRRILRVRKLTIYCECRVYAQSLAALIMIRVYELRSLAGGEFETSGNVCNHHAEISFRCVSNIKKPCLSYKYKKVYWVPVYVIAHYSILSTMFGWRRFCKLKIHKTRLFKFVWFSWESFDNTVSHIEELENSTKY